MWLIMLFTLFISPQEKEMELKIRGIQDSRGVVRIAIYKKKADFMEIEKAWYTKNVKITRKGIVRVQVPGADSGEYAISCYHDIDSNEKLNTNLLGVPTEPYGFSNKARPKFRAPNWEEAKVKFSAGNNQPVEVVLEKW